MKVKLEQLLLIFIVIYIKIYGTPYVLQSVFHFTSFKTFKLIT